MQKRSNNFITLKWQEEKTIEISNNFHKDLHEFMNVQTQDWIQEQIDYESMYPRILNIFFNLLSSFFSLDKSWAFATAGASESKELSDIHKHQTSSNLAGGCTLVKCLVPLMIQETSWIFPIRGVTSLIRTRSIVFY